jgi:hypothetical protein
MSASTGIVRTEDIVCLEGVNNLKFEDKINYIFVLTDKKIVWLAESQSMIASTDDTPTRDSHSVFYVRRPRQDSTIQAVGIARLMLEIMMLKSDKDYPRISNQEIILADLTLEFELMFFDKFKKLTSQYQITLHEITLWAFAGNSNFGYVKQLNSNVTLSCPHGWIFTPPHVDDLINFDHLLAEGISPKSLNHFNVFDDCLVNIDIVNYWIDNNIPVVQQAENRVIKLPVRDLGYYRYHKIVSFLVNQKAHHLINLSHVVLTTELLMLSLSVGFYTLEEMNQYKLDNPNLARFLENFITSVRCRKTKSSRAHSDS